MELHALTIHELQDKLRSGETTAADILASVYSRIAAVDDKVHAYITLTKEAAELQAAAADPPLEPPGIRSKSQGFLVTPK